MSDYELLDSGFGRKWERFGPYTLVRPASQALWRAKLSEEKWKEADGIFTREEKMRWLKKLEKTWWITVANLKFRLDTTDFGHLGIFPEQAPFWEWIQRHTTKGSRVLNLFAYSGGSTLAAAKMGAQVVHLDASKGMVAWAKENAEANNLKNIRWIVDDAIKFLKREVRRGNVYDGIILDPPSFGRGSKGEVFKIDEDIDQLLTLCHQLFSDQPRYFLFSCHTPGYTPTVMRNLLAQFFPSNIDSGEMFLAGKKDISPLPSGTFARWSADGKN